MESSGADGAGEQFRLVNRAVGDVLPRARAETTGAVADERTLARAFLAVGREAGWKHAPGYLLGSLPGHAARAGLIDELLADDEYLLYADLLRVRIWNPVTGAAVLVIPTRDEASAVAFAEGMLYVGMPTGCWRSG